MGIIGQAQAVLADLGISNLVFKSSDHVSKPAGGWPLDGRWMAAGRTAGGHRRHLGGRDRQAWQGRSRMAAQKRGGRHRRSMSKLSLMAPTGEERSTRSEMTFRSKSRGTSSAQRLPAERGARLLG